MTIVRRLAAGILLTALMLLSAPPLAAAGRNQQNLEHAVKAALIFNFAKFVEWPKEARDYQQVLVMCVQGSAELGELLEKSAEGKIIRDMRVRVEPAVTGRGAGECDILFISAALVDETSKILASLKERPVLTIGDDPDFLESGGIIRFKELGSRISFDISYGMALDARLNISSKLLQLADVVKEERSRP